MWDTYNITLDNITLDNFDAKPAYPCKPHHRWRQEIKMLLNVIICLYTCIALSCKQFDGLKCCL